MQQRIWVLKAEESGQLEDQEEEEGYFLGTFKKSHFEEPRLPSWLQYHVGFQAVTKV
jgi:hypothetical protein